MVYPNLVNDICPVSEFRAEINSMITKTQTTHRPIVLTQRGKGTAVVVGIQDYQSLLDKVTLLEEIQLGKQQIKDGQFLETTEAEKRLLGKYANLQD